MSYTRTLVCQICGKEFTQKRSHQRFCSAKCHGEYRRQQASTGNRPYNHTSTKKICSICGKEYWEYASRVKKTCSRKCSASLMRGESNPKYKSKIKKVCKNCGKKIEVIPCQKNRKNFCSKECWVEWYRKENHPCYIDGRTLVYCGKFNYRFRESVRRLFGYRCVLCNAKEPSYRKLSVHHVYYNKKACCQSEGETGDLYYIIDGKKFFVEGNPNKFAPLCQRCHSKTNHNRTYWATCLESLINSKYSGISYKQKMIEKE